MPDENAYTTHMNSPKYRNVIQSPVPSLAGLEVTIAMTSILLVTIVVASIANSSAWQLKSYRSFGAACCVAASVAFDATSALAKGGPEGSKTSKKFETCISTCVFDLTKPAPIGSGVERLEAIDQKSAISECRKKCAKSKAQLMTGEPKNEKFLTEDVLQKSVE